MISVRFYKLSVLFGALFGLGLLTSCGEGVYGDLYAITVKVDGVSSPMEVRANYLHHLDVPFTGRFQFHTYFPQGTAYIVEVISSPTGKTCVVLNGQGTINRGDINDVEITCS